MAFCKSLFSKLKKILKCVDDLLLNNIDRAISITSALKKILNSDGVIALTAIIPGEWDNLVRLKAVDALEWSLQRLGLIKDKLNDETLQGFINWLMNQPNDIKDSFLHKIASLVTSKLDGERFTKALYDLTVQAKYSETKPDLGVVKSV